MKRYTLLLLSFIVLFTSCQEEETEINLETTASCLTLINIFNKEEILKGHILPGDTVNLSFEIKASSLGMGQIDTLVIWPELKQKFENEKDTLEVDNMLSLFNKIIPINRSFEKEMDTIINFQVILPEYKVNRTVSELRPRIDIVGNLSYSDDDGRYERASVGGLYLNLLSTERIEYTFKLYNNYVGKPFDDPSGLGYNLFTREYLNTPCVLDNSCMPSFHYEESRFLELPTIYNMSYLPEANPEGKFFVPAFGNLRAFAGMGGFTKLNGYNLERGYLNAGHTSDDYEEYDVIVPEIVIGDVIILVFETMPVEINGNHRTPFIFLKVLDIVEANEDSYVKFSVTISHYYMHAFNEFHGL